MCGDSLAVFFVAAVDGEDGAEGNQRVAWVGYLECVAVAHRFS